MIWSKTDYDMKMNLDCFVLRQLKCGIYLQIKTHQYLFRIMDQLPPKSGLNRMSYPSSICVKVLVIFSSWAAVKDLWSHLLRMQNVDKMLIERQIQNNTWPFEGIKIRKIWCKSSFSKETLCVWLRHRESLNAWIEWILTWRWCSADVRSLGTFSETICGFVINLYEHIRLWCALCLTEEQIDIHNAVFSAIFTRPTRASLSNAAVRGLSLSLFPSLLIIYHLLCLLPTSLSPSNELSFNFYSKVSHNRSLALAVLLQGNLFPLSDFSMGKLI